MRLYAHYVCVCVCVCVSETGNDGQHRDSGQYDRLRPPGADLSLQRQHLARRRLPQERRHRDVPQIQSAAGEQT